MAQPAAAQEKRRPNRNGGGAAVQPQKPPVNADAPPGAISGGLARKPIITVERVQKYYKVGKMVVHVLKDINVTIYPKEFVIILGPSGSGKSTLLNSILGLEIPSEGRVVIQGEDLTEKRPNAIAKIRYQHFGVVFQRADWVHSLTTLNNVALPLAINDVPRRERLRRAWDKLKELDMGEYVNYTPTDLSGGQQQKVSLARALINDPPIIVADEPTGNLDSVSADKVMELLKRLNEERGKTILMVTHNIDYVRYGSRTIYIRDGRVVEGSEQL